MSLKFGDYWLTISYRGKDVTEEVGLLPPIAVATYLPFVRTEWGEGGASRCINSLLHHYQDYSAEELLQGDIDVTISALEDSDEALRQGKQVLLLNADRDGLPALQNVDGMVSIPLGNTEKYQMFKHSNPLLLSFTSAMVDSTDRRYQKNLPIIGGTHVPLKELAKKYHRTGQVVGFRQAVEEQIRERFFAPAPALIDRRKKIEHQSLPLVKRNPFRWEW